MLDEMHRGEIYFADLDPITGSEQGGNRPVLILSNDVGNKHSPTVIVAAITSREKNPLPTHIDLTGFAGLSKHSIVLLEQLRTLDKSRLGTYCGWLDERRMARVEAALALSLGMARRTQHVC
ncbi:MAG: type II toxin-antitoxin system PemK/MazF family toxin [Oscillospiraceae bacterium]|jgi:mRNA interferase MazF|nr:type II toxin-antitoxin system PemK/MazF family toxin [Oscillospiraceae bacterium]